LPFSYWIDKPWFLTEGKTCYCAHHTFLLGFPTGWLSCPHQAVFLVPLPGKKKTSARGVSHAHPLLCFSFALLYFYLHRFYQKHKKNSFLYSFFYLLAFSFVRMSNPEVEVRTFKQRGGESLKDAWYRISNSHHRCTKKHSTMILLTNFYVGISSWNRYVLDTLAGGNFLGTPALEACTLI
jgi:hypothetical protein